MRHFVNNRLYAGPAKQLVSRGQPSRSCADDDGFAVIYSGPSLFHVGCTIMKKTDLIRKAPGLTAPWKLVGVIFDYEKRRLNIEIDFERGATFDCPACGVAGCTAHDNEIKQWRHLGEVPDFPTKSCLLS